MSPKNGLWRKGFQQENVLSLCGANLLIHEQLRGQRPKNPDLVRQNAAKRGSRCEFFEKTALHLFQHHHRLDWRIDTKI